MGVVATLVADAKAIPTNVALCIGAAVVLAGATGWFIEHERNIGYAKCETKQEAAAVTAQTVADTEAPKAIAEVHAKYDPVQEAITHYGTSINEDLSKPADADCTRVPYVRAAAVGLRPGPAVKANKR